MPAVPPMATQRGEREREREEGMRAARLPVQARPLASLSPSLSLLLSLQGPAALYCIWPSAGLPAGCSAARRRRMSCSLCSPVSSLSRAGSRAAPRVPAATLCCSSCSTYLVHSLTKEPTNLASAFLWRLNSSLQGGQSRGREGGRERREGKRREGEKERAVLCKEVALEPCRLEERCRCPQGPGTC